MNVKVCNFHHSVAQGPTSFFLLNFIQQLTTLISLCKSLNETGVCKNDDFCHNISETVENVAQLTTTNRKSRMSSQLVLMTSSHLGRLQ